MRLHLDRVVDADEESFEVVLASLLDLAPLDVNVIDHQLLLVDQVVEVEAEGPDVLGQLLAGLLERDENPGLVELGGPANQELHGEDGLAASGGTADERGPAPGQAAAGDLIEPGDAGQSLREGQLAGVAAQWIAHQCINPEPGALAQDEGHGCTARACRCRENTVSGEIHNREFPPGNLQW